jgi:methionyl-tRNA formyltransferase
MAKKLHITLLMDNPHSWFAPYADTLAAKIEERGHAVTRVQAPQDIPEGDCAFFLSVEGIVKLEYLERNTHNIVIHASAVPQGKGWSPMTWQILEGKDDITISLFEAAERVDSGDVYDRETVRFDGSELIDELREKEAAAIQTLALRFIDVYPPKDVEKQKGKETFYPRRKPEDSELDPSKSLVESFNALRVADNERYPTFFKHKGHTYILKIYKKQ